jgi:hypothetical protein
MRVTVPLSAAGVAAMRFPLFVLIAALWGVSPAWADVSRTCEASLWVHEGSKPFNGSSGGNNAVQFGNIVGKAYCRNKRHANDCRRDAKSAIISCTGDLKKELWPDKAERGPPLSCRKYSGGRPSAHLVYDGIYPHPDSQQFLHRVVHTACCRLRPQAGKIYVDIIARHWGKDKCAKHKIPKVQDDDRYSEDRTIHKSLELYCPGWRAKGVCS